MDTYTTKGVTHYLPTCLYNKDGGVRVCETVEDVDAALAEGWVYDRSSLDDSSEEKPKRGKEKA